MDATVRSLETQLAEAHSRLAAAEARFGALVEQSLVGIFVLREGRFAYVNLRFAEIFGYEPEEMTNRLGFAALAGGDGAGPLAQGLERAEEGEAGPIQLSFPGLRKDGMPIDVELNGRAVTYHGAPALVGVALDTTESRRAERQLNYLAFYDSLTDLPNRSLLLDRLKQVLSQSRRYGGRFAVLMVDLDGFKAVNDALGHDAGDALLREVAGRLNECLRDCDTAARLGGDEFIVLLPGIHGPGDAATVARRIIVSLAEPFNISGQECRVGGSVGVCLFPDHAEDVDSLLSCADAAMYEAKAYGKNTFRFSRPGRPADAPVRVAFVALGEEHRLGVAELDSQHARMADLVNALGRSLKSGEPPEAVAAHLRELVGFARFHFEYEEGLMEQAGYPGLDQHRQEHRKLFDDVESLVRTIDNRSMVLTMQFLKDWLHRHILTLDKAVGATLVGRTAR